MPELLPYAPGSPEWLAARRAGVTATDIVTILGLSSWSSPYSLFWQKMGQVPETPDNDRFRLGRELEPYVACRWEDEHGRALQGSYVGAGLWRHSDRAWQMATLDRMLAVGTGSQPVELKTWADADKPAWQDGPPPAVRAQVLWQMDVMDVSTGHVGVVFLPSGEFRSYTIQHLCNDVATPVGAGAGCAECQDIGVMRDAGEEFMARLRLELPAPDPDASAATLAAVRARFTRQPDKTAEVNPNLYEQWNRAKIVRDGMDEQVRRLESELREQAGEASVLTVNGQPVACRIITDAQIKAHTRHSDYLRRIEPKETDDA